MTPKTQRNPNLLLARVVCDKNMRTMAQFKRLFVIRAVIGYCKA
jgi:hypothetical protein